MAAPCVTLLTDFGMSDGYVGAVKGVILALCPRAQLIDVAHDIAPGDILAGAVALMTSAATFPAGCVHLAVVDPGVGTDRSGLIVESGGSYFVGPDNGLLSLATTASRRAWKLDHPQWFRDRVHSTFHGRDVFAPVAARLADGVSPELLGSAVERIVTLEIPPAVHRDGGVVGEILLADRFGNLITTLREDDLPASRAATVVTIAGGESCPIVESYGFASKDTLVAVVGSGGFLEISSVGGSAREHLGAAGVRGTPVRVTAG